MIIKFNLNKGWRSNKHQRTQKPKARYHMTLGFFIFKRRRPPISDLEIKRSAALQPAQKEIFLNRCALSLATLTVSVNREMTLWPLIKGTITIIKQLKGEER